MILVYITNPTEEEAEKIAKILIEKKLIACANIFPIKSVYRWKDEIQKQNESVLIAKTNKENFERIKTEVEENHSYEVPCVLKIDADANEKYLTWVEGEIK